jgi:hypothetical protein
VGMPSDGAKNSEYRQQNQANGWSHGVSILKRLSTSLPTYTKERSGFDEAATRRSHLTVAPGFR